MIRVHAVVEQSSKSVTAVECTPLRLTETRYSLCGLYVGFRRLTDVRSLEDQKTAFWPTPASRDRLHPAKSGLTRVKLSGLTFDSEVYKKQGAIQF